MRSARIAVHVTPRAGRDEVAGWKGNELWVRVNAAPEGGNANAAVCRLLAKSLGVPKSSVSVTRGGASRHKQVEVEGVSDAELAEVLGEPDPGLF